MPHTEALTSIPDRRRAFGNPGEGGYVEYPRTQIVERWVIRNGSSDVVQPFKWTAGVTGEG